MWYQVFGHQCLCIVFEILGRLGEHAIQVCCCCCTKQFLCCCIICLLNQPVGIYLHTHVCMVSSARLYQQDTRNNTPINTNRCFRSFSARGSSRGVSSSTYTPRDSSYLDMVTFFDCDFGTDHLGLSCSSSSPSNLDGSGSPLNNLDPFVCSPSTPLAPGGSCGSKSGRVEEQECITSHHLLPHVALAAHTLVFPIFPIVSHVCNMWSSCLSAGVENRWCFGEYADWTACKCDVCVARDF